MFDKKNGNNYFVLGAGLVFFMAALALHQSFQKPPIEITKQDTAINVDRTFLKLISLGNKRLIAGVLWIQTLLESDLAHYKNRDLNSWMYLRFRSIAELDPKFYENYLYGGLFLSIVKDDLVGAADIYERGLKLFPGDYKLNYHAGFNYYFELGDFEKGLAHLREIENHPNLPPGIKFIIGKLKFETTRDYEATIAFIQYNLASTKDPVLTKKLETDLYSLTAERDLDCLNSGKVDCARFDIRGEPYIKTNSGWTTKEPFRPYKIFLRK
jgi:tetratricopeptide (TPR) repeat protein